jgi:GntR family transcriptional regulator, trigonelline degradation regulator
MARKADLRITPVTIQAQTAAKLRDAILDGIFTPGEKLLESDLCRQMGVSRTSVREALRQLEAERLVTIIPNRGPSVTQLTWIEAEQIYDARQLLEGEAAARFAERATAAEIAQAKGALADFDRAMTVDDAHGRLKYTQRFYDLIIEGCGNPIIGEMLQSLFARINFLRARSMSQKGRAKNSSVEMWRIFAAIEAKDSRAARSAAVQHVKSACAAAAQVFAGDDERLRSKGSGRLRRKEVAGAAMS